MYLTVKLPFGIVFVLDTRALPQPGCNCCACAYDDTVEAVGGGDDFVRADDRYECLRCGEVIHSGEPLDQDTAQLLMSVHICLAESDPS